MTRVVATALGIALAGSVIAISAAGAADLAAPPTLPPTPYIAPVEEFGGWYLRGHIGMSNQQVRDLSNALFDETVVVSEKEFGQAVFFGGGVGYQFNKWVRFDITGEYRAKADFDGFDSYTSFGGGTNDYTAKKTEWLVLANAYVDVGTWYGITPYIGAGIGASRNTLGDLTDINAVTAGGGYAGSDSEWNAAFALYAGFGYALTDRWTLDVGYRYVWLGDGRTGDIIGFDGTNAVYNPLEFEGISSHDIMVGLRYRFGGGLPSMGGDDPLFAKY